VDDNRSFVEAGYSDSGLLNTEDAALELIDSTGDSALVVIGTFAKTVGH